MFWTAKFEEQWSGCTDNTGCMEVGAPLHTALATAIAAAREHDGEIYLGVKFGRILLADLT